MKNWIYATILMFGVFSQTAGQGLAQEEVKSAHVTVENPAELSKEQSNKIYDELRDRLAESYALSRLTEIEDYQSWKRFNTAPYLSATHGQRFVNSYANDKVKNYGKLEKGQVYPVGSVFAKDSVTITDDDKIFPGAMFVMEKLAAGTSPKTADWRYIMVLPDGTLFGDTTGAESQQVVYCHTCHEAKAKDDYVFYVPEEFQLQE